MNARLRLGLNSHPRSGFRLLPAFAFLCLLAPLPASHNAQESRQLRQTTQPASSSGRRIALVIGNGSYTNAPPLKNPPNDARDMAATLKALGFEVTSGTNANQREMKRLIREFGQKLKAGGSGLFYYAGHGVQSNGRNYLIPVDADIQSEAEVEDSGVDLSLVLKFLDEAQNGLNIVILDACRNNPFARNFRSASSGLAQVDAPTGTLIAYSTAPGRVASDGTGQNGLYTSELLKQIRLPNLSVTDIFMRVRAEVMKQTASKQVPWEASSLVGAFYFNGQNTTGATAASPNDSKTDSAAFELSYWETIKNSNNPDDFNAYLEKYPNGQFTSLARNRIGSLKETTKLIESPSRSTDGNATELAFWDSIKNSQDPADFKDYLNKYPGGAFVGLANNRLIAIEAGAKERETAEAKQREAAELARISVAGTSWAGKSPGKDKTYSLDFAADGTFHMSLSFFGEYTIDGLWTQDHLVIQAHDRRESDSMPGMNGAEVNLTLSADGKRMEGEWHKKGGKKYGLVFERK